MASYSMAGPTTSTPPVLRSFSQRSKSRSGCTEPICTWATFKTLVTWTMKSWLVHDMILISRLILIYNWVGFHPLYTAKNQGYGISWNGLARDSTKKHVLCWKGMNTAIFVASHPKGRNRKLLRMGGWISWKEVQKHPRIQIMILCIYIYMKHLHQTTSHGSGHGLHDHFCGNKNMCFYVWQLTIDIFHYKVATYPNQVTLGGTPTATAMLSSAQDPEQSINPMLPTKSASIEWIEQ